jgi:hypothetical protein
LIDIEGVICTDGYDVFMAPPTINVDGLHEKLYCPGTIGVGKLTPAYMVFPGHKVPEVGETA